MSVLLKNIATVQVVMETTYGTPVAAGVNDGLLIEDPMYSADVQTLERQFVHSDLSPLAIITGRKIGKMTFSHELRGNGKQQSGLSTDAPLITRLFRACGFALTSSATKSVLVKAIGDHTTTVAWASSIAGATNTEIIVYYVKCTLGGASGTAKLTITSDTTGESTAEAVVTSASPITLGTKGATITPTWTGSLTLGDQWVVYLFPPGQLLTPISSTFESVTLYMNKGGVQHRMAGSYGTFDIEAEAGQFAKVNFEFQGIYENPTDVAVPSNLVYETTLPPMVEFARLRMDGFNAIVAKFTADMKVDIQPRPDVSSDDGYIGLRIVGRAPEGGIDPESDLVSNFDFWGKLSSSLRMPFNMRIGTTVGNTVAILAPQTQYTNMTYADRNNILNYDAGLRFARVAGDDEILFHFG
jgi:hypothetical protein